MSETTKKKDEEEDDEIEEEEAMPEELEALSPAEQQHKLLVMSFKSMLIGTFMVLLFSDPLVGVLSALGKAIDVSPF